MEKVKQLYIERPPSSEQTWNCWLCDQVPPGDECYGCPLFEEAMCDMFDVKTNGKKSRICKEKIRHDSREGR